MTAAPVAAPEPGAATAPSRGFRIEAMIFVGLFAILAVAIIVGAFSIREPSGSANTLSARVVPIAVGAMMLIASLVVLAQQWRGKYGDPDGGEDIDLAATTSWGTVVVITAAFLSLIVTIPALGWPIAVTILFFAASLALGAKGWVKPLVVGIALGALTQFLFGTLLGLSLPITGTLTQWIGL